MKLRYCLILFVIFIFAKGNAADPVYPVWSIPDSLREHAYAVVRYDNFSIDISSNFSASITNTYAVTILNSRGDDHAEFIAFYNGIFKLNSVSIRIYDAGGGLIENVKTKEVQDYSAINGFSLFEDNRVKYYKPSIKKYPYTLVISYQYTLSGFNHLPKWQPQQSADIAIEKAVFNISMHENNKVKWLTQNVPDSPVETRNGKIVSYSWEVNQIKAFKPEFMQPRLQYIGPVIHIAPLDFNLEGYKGSMESWESFGKWINLLLEGKNNLPEETRLKMKDLVSGVQDSTEMVRLIYQYMQQHTRYVSIQLGIGGFQPFDAETVDRVGYGDCKALTNYTQSLLAAVDIQSVYTLVRAGDAANNIIPEFPSQQFNHVILAVPLNGDTIWLECTNQNMPFGYLGEFTDNRLALAVSNNGGELVKTPKNDPDSNLVFTTANLQLDEDGNCLANFDICFSGLEYDEVFGFLHSDAENQRKWLIEHLYIPNTELIDYSFENYRGQYPRAVLKVDFKIKRFAVKSGKRMFVALNVLRDYPELPSKETERQIDIEVTDSYIHTDSLLFYLPEGYTVEYAPPRVELFSSFGEFSAEMEQSGNQIIYKRTLKVAEGTYDVSAYADFYAFYSKIVKSGKAKLVLISKDI